MKAETLVRARMPEYGGASCEGTSFLSSSCNFLNPNFELDEKARGEKAWKTFAKAIQIATDDMEKNKGNFDGDNAKYQLIDLDEARSEGIMPIPAP